MKSVAELWDSTDPAAWHAALERYWYYVKPQNLELEKSPDCLDMARIRELDADGGYDFLHNEYFHWKFTAAHRYAITTEQLQRYLDGYALNELDNIRKRLLALNGEDIAFELRTAQDIHGLRTAGASGLIALMCPQHYGTVDQFAVKALREVNGLPEAAALARMKPESLSVRDGVVLTEIYRRKASENNYTFRSTEWTPRKIDKILWTYGR